MKARSQRRTVADGPTLEDLAGYGRAKKLGLQIAADLRGYADGTVSWSEIDRGIVLAGAPGVGKTTYARALARSAGVPFFDGSYAEWQRHGHLGDFLAAMKATFDEARKAAPCVLLIDEIDSFQRRDGGGDSESSDYLAQCVNALLQHLDGSNERDGVFVVGATNHGDKIDPALTRSGRLERTVVVPLPDVDGLAAILRSILDAGTKAELTDVDLVPLALLGVGGSGADASAWIRRARATARRAERAMVVDDLRSAITDGRPALPSAVRWRVAVHEAGHVVAALATGFAVPTAAWIGGTGGMTEIEGSREPMTASRLRAQLAFVVAGREAERLVLGEHSDGAGGSRTSDLAHATGLAVQAIASTGLGAGPPVWLSDINNRKLSIPEHCLAEIESLIARAVDDARAIVEANARVIDRVAQALHERSRIDGSQIKELTGDVAPWTIDVPMVDGRDGSLPPHPQ